MISRYEVELNGKKLSKLHDNLLILDIRPVAPQISYQTLENANLNGGIVETKRHEKVSVAVDFMLRIYDIIERQTAIETIQNWARKGGELRTNDREGKYLNCVCEALPAIESARNWLDTLTVVFSAYDVPFWQSDETTSLTLTGISESGTMNIPGTADETPVNVTIIPASTLTELKIVVRGNTINLKNLSIPANRPIVIDHDEHDFIRIMSNGISLLANRTRASADDLLAGCGVNSKCSVSTNNVSVKATFEGRGRYL